MEWGRKVALAALALSLVPLRADAGAQDQSGALALQAGEWMGFRGGPSRNGSSDGRAPGAGDLLWSFDTGAPVQSSAVFAGDTLFIGSDSGRLYGLDAGNGRERWNRSFGEFATVPSTPYVSGGVVYVGSSNGSESGLFALNASDGRVLWRVPDDSGISASPALSGGRVYSASLNGSVVAVDAASGKVQWLARRDGEIWSSPALSSDTAYAGTTKGEVFALWASNGTLRWNLTFGANWMVYSTPAFDGGRVYVGASNYDRRMGQVVALDAATGGVIWRFRDCEGAFASPAVAGGAVYAHVWNKTQKGGYLVALPAEDPDSDGIISESEVLWSYQTHDWEGGSSPLAAANLVVVGSTDGNVSAVDRASGKLAWKFATGDQILSSPSLHDGKVYVGSMDRRVYALGTAATQPKMEVVIAPEKPALPSGSVMRINVWVRDMAGAPVEGAFVRMSVSAGNLSQNGASTFPDGSQTVKYLAPKVEENLTVRFTAEAARGGYAKVTNVTDWTVTEYASSYAGVRSQSSFNLAKYAPYIAAAAVLLALNVALLLKMRKTGWVRWPRRR